MRFVHNVYLSEDKSSEFLLWQVSETFKEDEEKQWFLSSVETIQRILRLPRSVLLLVASASAMLAVSLVSQHRGSVRPQNLH